MDPAQLPLGGVVPFLPAPARLSLGLVAVASATALLELSRTLAETYRGRWFAGNGRDLFHGGAFLTLAAALLAAGFALPLAGVAAALAMIAPLLVLDALPAPRWQRLAVLVMLVGLPTYHALLAATAVGEGLNALCRALLRS